MIPFNIKYLVDIEKKKNNHKYIYTAMRVVAKYLDVSESTISGAYYKSKNLKKDSVATKMKLWANQVIDWTLVREDHIPAFIDDSEKLIVRKLRMAFELGKKCVNHAENDVLEVNHDE